VGDVVLVVAIVLLVVGVLVSDVISVLKGRSWVVVLTVGSVLLLFFISLMAFGASVSGDEPGGFLNGAGFLVVGLGVSVPTVGAALVAKPSSWWARRFYDEERMAGAVARFPRQQGRAKMCVRLLDGLSGELAALQLPPSASAGLEANLVAARAAVDVNGAGNTVVIQALGAFSAGVLAETGDKLTPAKAEALRASARRIEAVLLGDGRGTWGTVHYAPK